MNDISLAYLSNEDCRLLRNSIFYYHGYSFKSDELREYFYNYYTRTTSNETPLSDIDNKNVELIKLYETREFSTEKELKTQKLPEDFIGSWYLEGFTIGNDDPANLKINKNSTFNFYFLNNGGSSYYRGFGGNVYVYRNTMFLYINEILISEEKRKGGFDPQYDYSAPIKSYNMNLDEPIVLTFPIKAPEKSEAKITVPEEYITDKYVHMSLGKLMFFKK